MDLDILNHIGTVLGIVVGVSALVLGAVNFLRDKAKVVVGVVWDLSVTDGYEKLLRYRLPMFTEEQLSRILDQKNANPSKYYAVVTIHNTGRRPVFVSHACFKLPKGSRPSRFLFKDAIAGRTLKEGDPPMTIVMEQVGMEKYSRDWRDVIAEVTDSTGRVWRSQRTKKKHKPSWAKACQKS
ncbi:MAG: hypothetical protein KOO62_07035 [candidate division Zixibacteria bacterium]|nr:hypothetical protein [candidate division Zixibacteria bacterium]